MTDNILANAEEIFSAPIEGVIVALGRGIAQAQGELDRNSIKSQELIDADPVLSGYGLQATWYQFPKVDLQLKMALSVTEETPPPPSAPPGAPAAPVNLVAASTLRLIAQPLSAAYQNHFNYDAEASSVITLSIVPVPNPRTGDPSTLPARMKPADVQKAALASSAKFATAKDAQGNTIPAPNLRFDMNFNAVARLWYVLQYDPANSAATPVVVAVDDVTGAVRVISTP